MKTILIGVAAWLLAVSTASADVQLTMRNGRVTLVAKDATVRQILAEWARVGHTKIVNLEAVPGGPITLQLDNVTEAQALDVLLRSLRRLRHRAARRSPSPPTCRGSIASSSCRRSPPRGPPSSLRRRRSFSRRRSSTPSRHADDSDDDKPAPPAGAAPPPAPRGPVFNTFPQPQVVSPPPQAADSRDMPAGRRGRSATGARTDVRRVTDAGCAARRRGGAGHGRARRQPTQPGQVPGQSPVRRSGRT